jgi:hypothetical protein
VHIDRIDTTPPTAVNVSYSPNTSTLGIVEVTLLLDTVITPIPGWIGTTGQVFTRTYAANTTDTVQFFDLAGNVGSTGIFIDWIQNPDKQYGYNGSPQTFIIPKEGWYQIELRGAQGGPVGIDIPGRGGYTRGKIKLNAGEQLFVYV